VRTTSGVEEMTILKLFQVDVSSFFKSQLQLSRLDDKCEFAKRRCIIASKLVCIREVPGSNFVRTSTVFLTMLVPGCLQSSLS
jgi:hypothetical protein